MIIDAHCHAWRRWPYDTTVPDADHRGSAEALLWQLDAHNVDRAAIVAARIGAGRGGDGYENEDNNRYVAEFVAAHPDRFTAWVDVDCAWRPEYHSAGATERLEREVSRSGVTGFTHYFRPDNDGWLRSAEGSDFFAAAARAGLIASLAVSPAWYADLRVVARANPSLPILIHHLGQPRTTEMLDAVCGLADLPNILIKVSGFNYSARQRWAYPFPEIAERYRRIAAAFGPERLHWGSDFPASRDDLTYAQSLAVVRDHSSFLDAADLTAVLGDNSARLLARPRLTPTEPEHNHPQKESPL